MTVSFTDGSVNIDKVFNLTLAANSLERMAGSAMNFDGDGDVMTLGNQSLLDFGGTKNYTFEAWVKPNVANASGHIFSKYNRFIAGQYFLSMDNGHVVSQREVSPYSLHGTTILAANKWVHLAATYDGNEMKIYIDGKLEASQISSGSASNNSTSVTIGGGYYNGGLGYFINAQIDELRIWNIARTPQQIRENRHLTVSSCENGLVANFQFNEVSGNPSKFKHNGFQYFRRNSL